MTQDTLTPTRLFKRPDRSSEDLVEAMAAVLLAALEGGEGLCVQYDGTHLVVTGVAFFAAAFEGDTPEWGLLIQGVSGYHALSTYFDANPERPFDAFGIIQPFPNGIYGGFTTAQKDAT